MPENDIAKELHDKTDCQQDNKLMAES